MLRKEIYNEVVAAFERKYSWLGKQFAEEFLASVASSNIQNHSNPEFRVRRHLLLFWKPGWVKTSLLMKAYSILTSELCTHMTDITLASLRGTVEANSFISPFTLKRPFSICTEFGQVLSGYGNNDITQKLLNVLEEGIVMVSLGKISYLSEEQRIKAAQEYHITFLDRNTFSYSTNWVLMASTYNRKFLYDSALESRFNIMVPEQKLDTKLTRHLTTTSPFELSEEVKEAVRGEIVRDKPISTSIRLPSVVYDTDANLTPRDCGSILSHVLCRAWWNINTPTDDIRDLVKAIRERRESIWKTADDKVFECIDAEPMSAKEIAEATSISKRQVYNSLKTIGASKTFDSDGNVKYKMA